jgi:hypothetical protein
VIHVGDLRANQVDGARAIRLDQPVQEEIFALERAADRTLQRPSQRGGQPDEERVRQVDDVGDGLVGDPLEQLVELPAQDALVPLEHRNGHVAQQARVGRHCCR